MADDLNTRQVSMKFLARASMLHVEVAVTVNSDPIFVEGFTVPIEPGQIEPSTDHTRLLRRTAIFNRDVAPLRAQIATSNEPFTSEFTRHLVALLRSTLTPLPTAQLLQVADSVDEVVMDGSPFPPISLPGDTYRDNPFDLYDKE